MQLKDLMTKAIKKEENEETTVINPGLMTRPMITAGPGYVRLICSLSPAHRMPQHDGRWAIDVRQRQRRSSPIHWIRWLLVLEWDSQARALSTPLVYLIYDRRRCILVVYVSLFMILFPQSEL